MARNRKNQSAAIRFGPALKAMLLCLMIGGSGVGYVWQKSQIQQLSKQISERETQLKKLIEQNRNDQKNLAEFYSAPRLKALNQTLRLGFQQPEEQQIWRLAEPLVAPAPVPEVPPTPAGQKHYARNGRVE
jgi:uncharacterized protein HemX